MEKFRAKERKRCSEIVLGCWDVHGTNGNGVLMKSIFIGTPLVSLGHFFGL